MTDTALDARPGFQPAPPMSDEERTDVFKVAKALAESGFFKDAKGAQQALAKILIGRDLGLSPAESMTALHVFDGKVEASADFHATRVRSREGYDYTAEWFGTEGTPAFGCKVTIYGPHLGEPYQQRGESEFTLKDAETAGIGKKDVWKKYPRNMLFARAMSNGVAWFCPEVMGAVRIYSPGEAEDAAIPVQGAEAPDLPLDVLASLPLGESVCATVRRARKLGHAGYSNVATVQMALTGQPQEKVSAWLERTNDELDELARKQREGDAYVEPEPEDAVVVDGDDGEPVPGLVSENQVDGEFRSSAGSGSGGASDDR